MPSSWETSGPKRKLVDTHAYVGYFYGFISTLLALVLAFSMNGGIAPAYLAVLGLGIMLTLGHFKLSDAVERDRHWVPAASVLLALPLLLAFPIGTYFGSVLLVNTARLK
jgi:hypothetical protein